MTELKRQVRVRVARAISGMSSSSWYLPEIVGGPSLAQISDDSTRPNSIREGAVLAANCVAPG